MSTTIQLRRDTAANWTSVNTVLAQGEIGYEVNTGSFKIGDGSTAWNALAYSTNSITLALNAETSRATTAEAAVSSAVTAETTRATNAEAAKVTVFNAPLVKTNTNYSMQPWDQVLTNATTQVVALLLPNAPANHTRVYAKQLSLTAPYNTTLTCQGSDVLNVSGGSSVTATLSILSHGMLLEYNSGVWVIQTDDLPLGQLDLRYLPQAGGTITGPLSNTNLARYHLDTFTGTDDQKMTAALAAVASFGSGEIVLAARSHTFNNQWTTTYSYGTVNTIKISGAGGGAIVNDLGGQVSAPNNGATTICNMAYAGGGAARMDFQHIGVIEIHGILFRDSGGSSVPFFQTTNAVPTIYDNGFVGSAVAKNCFQDAIVLGGTNVTTGAGDSAPYQGYPGHIFRNYFSGIRRGVFLQTFANAIQIDHNSFTGQCGSNLPTGAAFELSSAQQVAGNSIFSNLVEMGSYGCAVKCTNAPQNILGPNALFDGGSGVVAYYYLDINSTNCIVTGGVAGSSPLVYDESMSTLIMNAQRSGKPISGFMTSSPASFYGPAVNRNTQLGFMSENYSGDRVALVSANLGAGIYPKMQLWAAQATSVADGSTISGSNIVTSATAAFAYSDIGVYIHATQFAANAVIQWVYTHSSPDAHWQASTAYVTGAIAVPTSFNSHLYQATTGGTTASAQPAFPTDGSSVTDGSVVWADLGTTATAALLRNPGSGAAINASATATAVSVTFGRQGTATTIAGPSFQNSHIVGTGTTPAWAVGAAAGSGASITANSGTDTAQLVKITTGTGTTTGTMATGTVGNTVTSSVGQFATISAANTGGASCITAGLHIVPTNTGWTITCDGAPPASTACWFYIHTTY